MAFNTDNDYTNFENFDSSPPLGNSEGRVQPEETASGFRYAKRILRYAQMDTSGSLNPLTGKWRVILRESLPPDSRVLFDQTINLKLQPVFEGSGAGVTFYDVKNRDQIATAIVNGQTVPINAEGYYEGWRFVDSLSSLPPTQFAEQVIPKFKPNSGATIDGLYIDAVWESAHYKIEVPPGAVFRVEDDQWRQGADIPITFYTGSILVAPTPAPALFDTRTGQQFRALSHNGQTRVLRSRRQLSPLKPAQAEWSLVTTDGLAFAKSLRGLTLSRASAGSLFLLGQEGPVLHLLRSIDEAKTWQSLMTQPTDITLLAARLTRGGARFIIYGIDKNKVPSYVILKNEAEGWAISESGPCQGQNLPTSKVNSLEEAEGGTLRLLATTTEGNLQLFHSPDGKTYQQASLPPITNEP